METTVSARLDKQLKEDAEAIMKKLGVTHSVAIQALYAQIVYTQSIPFDIALPQPKTSLSQISKAVQKYAKVYGIEKVYLFGSYARGSADSQSDVDLRIDKGSAKGLELGGFLSDISEALGVDVDVATTDSLNQEFLDSIKDEEVLIYAA
jgi:uncharacterized protein